MLASGQSPVYPAHIPPAELRTRCVGTGPFKLKEWRRGEFVEYVSNPDYFVKGRPYLDGLRYFIVSERGRQAARCRRGGWTCRSRRHARSHRRPAQGGGAAAGHHRGGQQTSPNLLVNTTRPPFSDVRVRRASTTRSTGARYPGGAAGRRRDGRGHAVAAARHVGSERARARALPGYGKAGGREAKAQAAPGRGGVHAGQSAQLEMHDAGHRLYLDLAAFVVSELKRVGVEATVKQVDTVQWYGDDHAQGFPARRQRQRLRHRRPDAIFYENYGCGSIRNYTGYCDELVSKLIEQQSQELDPKKRLALVRQILPSWRRPARAPPWAGRSTPSPLAARQQSRARTTGSTTGAGCTTSGSIGSASGASGPP